MSLFFAHVINLWQIFGLPYKVPDTHQNAIIPKRKNIFEFTFMPLKKKIVLKDSLFILN